MYVHTLLAVTFLWNRHCVILSCQEPQNRNNTLDRGDLPLLTRGCRLYGDGCVVDYSRDRSSCIAFRLSFACPYIFMSFMNPRGDLTPKESTFHAAVLRLLFLTYYDEVAFLQEHNARYCINSSHLNLISSNVRGVSFLTSV